MHPHPVTRLAASCASIAMIFTLGACGGAEPAAPSTAAADAEPAAAPDAGAFCAAQIAFESKLSEGPPIDESTPPEEVQAALAEYATQVEPEIAAFEQAAPDEVRADVETQTRLLRESLTTGDPSVFEAPEFTAANDAIDEYMLGACGFPETRVVGVDHEYEGLPATLPAGTTALTFVNEGEEQHMIGLVRVNDGVTESVEELLALPEEQAMQMVTFVGAAFAVPGDTDTTFLDLPAGRYGAVCFISEGSVGDQEGTGPPHFTLGMAEEVTVA